jgi:hypothetical protein
VWRFGGVQQDRAHNQIGILNILGQGVSRGLEEDQRRRNIPFELRLSPTIYSTDKHLGAHPVCSFGRMLPYHPIANDHDFAIACAEDSAKLHAFAVVEFR